MTTEFEKCPHCDRLYPGTIAHNCPSVKRHVIIRNEYYCSNENCRKPLINTDEIRDGLCTDCLNKEVQGKVILGSNFKESCSDGGCMPAVEVAPLQTQTETRVASRGGLTVYLSGPMSGLPDYNRSEFHKYAEEYRRRGYHVINPAEVDIENNRSYEYYIRKTLGTFSSDVNIARVYFLPGWKDSKGARLEFHLAKILGIARYDVTTGEMITGIDMETFEGGAVREPGVVGSKTARYDLLLETKGARRLAETYGEGAVKYGDNNWKSGIPNSNLFNHLLAHIYAYMNGDRAEDHLAHAAWGLFAVMEFDEHENYDPFPENTKMSQMSDNTSS